MDDDRPRAPTYGPPITIPSPEFLGQVAYHTWFEADLPPALDWGELSEPERDTWRRVAQKVAERIRVATERSHALGNYLPPPRCPAQRRDLYTSYICCRWDPHPADHATDDEGTAGSQSSRELAPAALARRSSGTPHDVLVRERRQKAVTRALNWTA